MKPINQSTVHLVGSVPMDTTADVLDACAREVGHLVAALPDGEPNERSAWVNYQALRVFYSHPQLDTVRRPEPVDGQDQWIPNGLDDMWQFELKKGVDHLSFDDLHYAGAAIGSYLTFRELRDAAVIPPDVRFQISLPLTDSATVWFFADKRTRDLAVPAYQRAMIGELEKIFLAIPPEDVSIQWDVCFEVLDVEGAVPWSPDDDPMGRYRRTVHTLSEAVPEEALVGYHLCYADLGHHHFKEPADLTTSVIMANATVEAAARRTDYFHVAVPRDRTDDAYFAPLEELDIGEARLFLGLVHYTDGLDGTAARIEAARKHLAEFGISTECGFGRRPSEQVRRLLAIHREASAQLA